MKKAILFLTMLMVFAAALPVQAAEHDVQIVPQNKQEEHIPAINAKLIHAEPTVVGRKFKGFVTVEATLDTNGTITKADKIMISSGDEVIDSIACGMAMRWKYTPMIDTNGNPMKCHLIIRINFK